MTKSEIILRLEDALVKLDDADEQHAALKIAEALEILETISTGGKTQSKYRHHDND